MATTNEELLKQQAATGTQPSRTDQINALYDAQKEAQLNELKGAYEQNLSNAQAARDKLPGQYQQSQNDLATQYERNRLNMNRQFSANGINTGAASQAQLSRSNEYLRDFGKLKAAENQAIADADRGINDLTAAYNRNVASAGANVEASRTGALLDEGARQQQQDLNKAQLLAGYGDFSGFAALYGDNVANNMLAIWKAQNPDLAYRTGQMTPQEYYSMTGKWPAGYSAGGGYGGGYGGGGYDEAAFQAERRAILANKNLTTEDKEDAIAALYSKYNASTSSIPNQLHEASAAQGRYNAAVQNREIAAGPNSNAGLQTGVIDAVAGVEASPTTPGAAARAAQESVVRNSDGSLNWGETFRNVWNVSKNIMQTGSPYVTKDMLPTEAQSTYERAPLPSLPEYMLTPNQPWSRATIPGIQ